MQAICVYSGRGTIRSHLYSEFGLMVTVMLCVALSSPSFDAESISTYRCCFGSSVPVKECIDSLLALHGSGAVIH